MRRIADRRRARQRVGSLVPYAVADAHSGTEKEGGGEHESTALRSRPPALRLLGSGRGPWLSRSVRGRIPRSCALDARRGRRVTATTMLRLSRSNRGGLDAGRTGGGRCRRGRPRRRTGFDRDRCRCFLRRSGERSRRLVSLFIRVGVAHVLLFLPAQGFVYTPVQRWFVRIGSMPHSNRVILFGARSGSDLGDR